MTTVASLKDRYIEVKERIAEAAQRGGTDPNRVVLVAVTKFADPDRIRELVRLGHVDFGENRVQQLVQRAAIIDEWLARHRTMPSTPIPTPVGEEEGGLFSATEAGGPGAGGARRLPSAVRWHMIGHLQRNKARKAVEVCRLIQTVDSLRVAEELQAVAEKRNQVVDVLVQVNVAGEQQKTGCAVPAARHLAEQIDTMVQVRVRGMMTMAPFVEDPEQVRGVFGRARELFDEIRDAGIAAPHFNILSMGMSNDYEVALQEGANLVRVGSAIFGEPDGSTAPDGEGDSDEE